MRLRKGNSGMKLFLDCESTQLNQDTKLISLAFVSEAGDEFYVEMTDTYEVEDCRLRNPERTAAVGFTPLWDFIRGGPSRTKGFPRQYRRPTGSLLGRPRMGLGFFLSARVCGSQIAKPCGEQTLQPDPFVQAF